MPQINQFYKKLINVAMEINGYVSFLFLFYCHTFDV